MSEISEAGQEGDARRPSDLPWGPWSPWHPPAPLWGVGLLVILTFGFYLPFWVLRVAEDLESHGERDLKPWQLAVGSVVPVLGWIQLWRLIQKLTALLAEGLTRPRTNPTAAAVLAVLAMATWHGALAHLLAVWELSARSLSFLALALGFLGLTLTFIQHRFNLYKEAQEGALWTGAPYRFSGCEASVVAVIAIFWVYTAFSGKDVIKREIALAQGEALSAGQQIKGDSGLYTLTLPAEGWVRVGSDTIHKGADLSLYGASSDTYLVTYIRCDDTSINSRVEFRRKRKRGALKALTIAEERRLESDSLLPVSYALYAGRYKQSGDRSSAWVATVAKDDFLVEAIGAAGGRGEDQAVVEQMVKSLRIDEEATSCES